MPTYSWSCPECGSEFTRILSVAEYGALPPVVCTGTADQEHDPVPVKRVYEVAVVIPEGFHE